MWEICDAQPFLLLPTVLDLRLLFRKLFMVGPYLLSLSAWCRNPQLQSADMQSPWAWAAILNSGVPTALNLRSGRKNEIMRMISSFQKISKSGATTARADSLTFYAPLRNSITIPASLRRGEPESAQGAHLSVISSARKPWAS